MEEFVTNLKEFLGGMIEEPKIIERIFANKVRDICYTLHHSITNLTPVNTGRTLANYQWSTGAPAVGMVTESGSGQVEATNSLALGVESRRPENQAIADASLASINFSKPFQSFYLTNNDPTTSHLEDGEWPEAPFVSRSPQGMFTISFIYVEELLASGVI